MSKLNKLNKYRIKFNINGDWLIWERFGIDMESTMTRTKEIVEAEFGDSFKGSIIICGDQGNNIFVF